MGNFKSHHSKLEGIIFWNRNPSDSIKHGKPSAATQMISVPAGPDLSQHRDLADPAESEDSFMEDHMKNLPPPDYLNAWLLHAKVGCPPGAPRSLHDDVLDILECGP